MKVAVLTISDRCARGEVPDLTGPALREALVEVGAEVLELRVIPDEREMIQAELLRLSDQVGADVVITSGGTGLGPRDVTPEATEAVLERRAPGIAEAMRMGSLVHTPTAMLSRGTAGLRGTTLIVNLPGSPRGATECLGIILPALGHALDMIAGCGHRPQTGRDGGKSPGAT
ncbi:MAG TPA: MogA/MoaB family molybdenum cofactor biosynthesis protein [Armatimonadota bacterium]|nr:MogA/MoaB family molybdenum cofactor biosynthesis protein [Armatimonadota bacterium]